MLKAIRKFIDTLTDRPAESPFQPNDHRLAAAALMHHVIAVDGIVSPQEQEMLQTVLEHQFALDDDESADLADTAREADLEAVHLYGFTSLLKRHLDEAGRLRVIGMMWEMAYADGHVDEFEDNVVWRVAELLGVTSRDRIRLKQSVRAAAGAEGDGWGAVS